MSGISYSKKNNVKIFSTYIKSTKMKITNFESYHMLCNFLTLKVSFSIWICPFDQLISRNYLVALQLDIHLLLLNLMKMVMRNSIFHFHLEDNHRFYNYFYDDNVMDQFLFDYFSLKLFLEILVIFRFFFRNFKVIFRCRWLSIIYLIIPRESCRNPSSLMELVEGY